MNADDHPGKGGHGTAGDAPKDTPPGTALAVVVGVVVEDGTAPRVLDVEDGIVVEDVGEERTTSLYHDAGHRHTVTCFDPDTDQKTAACRAHEKTEAPGRERAEKDVLARLAQRYPDGDVPPCEGPGSPKFDSDVRDQLAAAERNPLLGYTSVDWRPAPAMAEGRDLARLRVLAEDVEDAHGEHHVGRGHHPFCPACDPHQDEGRGLLLRFTRWAILNPSKVPSATGDITPPKGSDFLSRADLANLPPASWLIGEILPAGSIGYLTGRDGTYKTFLALDFGLHLVAEAERWNGREVHWGENEDGEGGCLFVASEGVGAMDSRISAWEKHHGQRIAEGWTLRKAAVNLYAGGADFENLLATAERMKPQLIVIDTLNRCAGAADQNSASDMSVITARVAMLQRAGGPLCSVLVIAHTDKGDNDARGSSAIEDDADFVLHAKADDDRLTLTVAKMKDGRSGQELSLRVLPVLDSLVVVEAKPEPQWASDSLAERIKGVLFDARLLDRPTGAQVFDRVQDDGTGKPASKATLYRVLGDLVGSGGVLFEDAGRNTKRYRLSPSEYPKDVQP